MRRARWIALAACAALAAGCGGGSERQDADEPSGTWTVDVEAEFPRSQRLAEQETMRISVRNDADRAVPNVAVTVDSFSQRSEQAGLADPERPVWIVDQGPSGGDTAYTDTWALGRLAPGETKTFEWRVTPVEAGRHRVTWRVSAGLDGKAEARLPGGEAPEGTFAVSISDTPAQARVDPDSGEVLRD